MCEVDTEFILHLNNEKCHTLKNVLGWVPPFGSLFILIKEEPKLLLKCHILTNVMGFIHHMDCSCVQTAIGKRNLLIWTLGQKYCWLNQLQAGEMKMLSKWLSLRTYTLLSLLSPAVALPESLTEIMNNWCTIMSIVKNTSAKKWHSVIRKDSKFWNSEILWKNNTGQPCRKRQGLLDK